VFIVTITEESLSTEADGAYSYHEVLIASVITQSILDTG